MDKKSAKEPEKDTKIKEIKETQENKEKQENTAQINERDELGEMKETLQRLQAEFENYQKRAHKESEHFRTTANASLIHDLLPVLDTLEQASIHNKEFVAVKEQLEGILKKKGLGKIHTEKGKEFDHNRMDCLMEEHCEGVKEGKIAKVLINGYTLNGCVLRPAKVSIAKAKSTGDENKKHGSESGNENKQNEKQNETQRVV